MVARGVRVCSFALLSLLILSLSAGAQGRPDLRWMRGGHNAYLTRLTYASNGTFFVSASQDRTLKIWRASDNLLLRTIVVEGGSFTAALSPDDSTLCSDGRDAARQWFVACWHVADGSLVWKTITSDGVGSLSFSPDGLHLASIDNLSFKIWRASDGVPIANYRSPNDYGYGAVSYSPDGGVLATNGGAPRLVLLNPSTGGLLWDFGTALSFGYDIAFSPDSQRVATVNGSGLHVFGTYDHSGSIFPLGSPATKVAFSRNGSRIASSGYKLVNGAFTSYLNLFDAVGATLIKSWVGHGYNTIADGPVAFSADSTRLISAVRDIKRWNAVNGNFDQLVTGHVSAVRLLAMSANEKVVATSTWIGSNNMDEHVISLFRASDGALLRYVEYGPAPLLSLALSPDGTHVAAGDNETLRVWNVGSGALERSRAEHVGGGSVAVRPIAYSPDGTVIAENGNFVELWNPTTDTLTPLVNDSPTYLQYLPDGKLALGFTDSVKIVTAAGAFVRSFSGLTNIAGIAVSPDGTMVAAAGTDVAFSPRFVARVWRISDGATLQTLTGHTATVMSVGFSWDNQTVVTAAMDATARIWRVSDGAQVRLYDQETYLVEGFINDGLFSLASSRLSGRFVYGRGDGTIVMAENPLASPTIMSMTVPSAVTGSCKTASVKVVLDRPAPPSGAIVSLASSNPVATVPATLAIKAGTTSKAFKVTTTAVAAATSAVITATLGDDMAEGTLNVRPIGIGALTLVPLTVTGGTPVAGTVSLECNASPGAINVLLSSTIPASAQPAVSFVSIPAGSKDGAFTVNTSPVTAVKKPAIAAETVPDATRKSKKVVVNP